MILVALSLRFIPKLNDAISGRPHYMRTIATLFARGVAEKTEGQSAVIVTDNGELTCTDLQTARTSDLDDVFYVLSYSEGSRSVCFTSYVPAPQPRADAITLDQHTGKNYGTLSAGAVAVQSKLQRLNSLQHEVVQISGSAQSV
jgi:hypothetical protein